MRQKLISLDAVEITVIDGADHMADLGFLPGVTRILAATPSGGQRMLFSATLDNGVDKLVKRFLTNEVSHSVDSQNSPCRGHDAPRVPRVRRPEAKKELVHRFASGTGRRILFMRTKHQARKLANSSPRPGIPSVDLHGNLSAGTRPQPGRFTEGEPGAGRHRHRRAQVHVDDVELVVHGIDPPAEHRRTCIVPGAPPLSSATGDVVTVVLPSSAATPSVARHRDRLPGRRGFGRGAAAFVNPKGRAVPGAGIQAETNRNARPSPADRRRRAPVRRP